MGDFKSKLPSLQELTSMAGKLAKGVKTSVSEIIDDYKKNHPADAAPAAKPVEPEQPKAAAAVPEQSKAPEHPKAEAPKEEEKKQS